MISEIFSFLSAPKDSLSDNELRIDVIEDIFHWNKSKGDDSSETGIDSSNSDD